MSLRPTSRLACQICLNAKPRYTCPKCAVAYCSVGCYRIHSHHQCGPECQSQETISTPSTSLSPGSSMHTMMPLTEDGPRLEQSLDVQGPDQQRPLRALASLRWPYVAEESAYPDPLKRDDPKPLQLHHYEAIATSPAIRAVFANNPQLPALLTSIDNLRGPERDFALQRALGITNSDLQEQARGHAELSADVISFRELAETVEAAVRGDKEGVLGLDWEQ